MKMSLQSPDKVAGKPPEIILLLSSRDGTGLLSYFFNLRDTLLPLICGALVVSLAKCLPKSQYYQETATFIKLS